MLNAPRSEAKADLATPEIPLSVIVPMLNEAEGLADFLTHSLDCLPKGAELILVDGGSLDKSRNIAEGFPVNVLQSRKGRALQMNLGAEAAAGEYLMFLHADTFLSETFSVEFETWRVSSPRWGFSPVRLNGSSYWCRVIEAGINLRTRLTYGASGDQAQLVRADCFRQLAGFREIDLMEDIDLSYRLRKQCSPKRLIAPVITSSRRWRSGGVLRTVFLMWFLRLSFRLGIPPRQLAQLYART